MQNGKTFKTYNEAKDFARFHKRYWIHTIWDGGTSWVKRHIAGYHVVFIVQE